MRLTKLLHRSSLYFHFHNVERWPTSMLEQIKKGCSIQPNFITEEEEKGILLEVEPHMKRLKYEKAHWDDAIYLYREREQRNWSAENSSVVERIQNASFTADLVRSAHVHILDLHQDGHIRPHVDSERYCGEVVSGVSLLSDCVMRLRHVEKKDELVVDLLLKRLSLYKLSGPGRHEFTHEILSADTSAFGEEKVVRGRRISIICRDIPRGKPKDDEIFKATGRTRT